MKHTLIAAALIAAIASILTSSVSAQTPPTLDFPKASPSSVLKQRFGLTDVDIEYARPSVKGRKIFGALVPFGEVWRTGANTATKITFSTDVKFGGQAVPAGSYALFTIPTATEWTVILSKVTGAWGAYSYDAKDDLLRVKVKPVALADMVESFTIDVGDLRDDTTNLTLSWEKTRVSVKLENNLIATMVPQIEAAMKAQGEKPYFPAAMFFYEHDLDLKRALGWMDAAIKEKPDAMWMIYRRGLILEKSGDKAGALAAAQQSLEMAKKAGGPQGAEYTHLSEALIARVK
jgi:hypothetical protein